jgi:hypothetical protein
VSEPGFGGSGTWALNSEALSSVVAGVGDKDWELAGINEINTANKSRKSLFMNN